MQGYDCCTDNGVDEAVQNDAHVHYGLLRYLKIINIMKKKSSISLIFL